ncbi:MAG: NAD-dependent epimerase/dehydratase family protein [Desulfuromonadales bacterium]
MKLPKLLITGSKGKIGTVLEAGLAHSFEIYGVDRAVGLGGRLFCADISDYDQIHAVVKQIAPIPYIVHLAGEPRVDADWPLVLKNNIIATRNLYEAARTNGAKRIIFASSNHVTGGYESFSPDFERTHESHLITVRDSVRPDSDYGASKVFGEALAREYYDRFGLESVCLRLGMVSSDDDPTGNERNRKVWLSHKDLIQLVTKSLIADIGFGIYYGVSNNKDVPWDISNAKEELGYHPEDDASNL